MSVIIRLLITTLAVLLAAYIVPGIVVSGFYVALIVAVILGVLNIFVRPLILLLALPITLLTFGLFTLVVNALLFWFVSTFVDGFYVDGFVPAFLGALVVAAAGWLGHKLVKHG